MRIPLVVRQRIPADVVSEREIKRDESDERGPPPTSFLVKLAARHPCPVVVVKDPAAVVIRSPTPRFIPDPGPTVRRKPRPMTVAIRRPVRVRVQHAGVRTPDPAVILAVNPLAVRAQFFGAPQVLVEILVVVTQPRREITLTLVYPLVVRVARARGEQVPITGGVASRNQLSRAAVA